MFLTNPKYFDNPKYEFIFSTLRAYTTLPLSFVKFRRDSIFSGQKDGVWIFYTDKSNPEWFDILKAAENDYDFVITSKIDFDDFVFKDAVKEAQAKVAECEDILVYGYNNGYTYIYGDLYRRRCNLWKDTAHESIFQSLILKSDAVKNLPVFFAQDFWHSQLKPQLKVFLEKNGVEFQERMFQQDFSSNAFIYFRHDFSQEQICANGGKPFDVSKLKPLTNADITKEQLASEFGFTLELKSIK